MENEGKVVLDVVTINKEIYESGKRLEKGSKELFNLAQKVAECEEIYRHSLSIEIEKLRLEKVPATLIPDIARGHLSQLKFDRDVAEMKYKAAIKSLEAIQAQQNGLQSINKYLENI